MNYYIDLSTKLVDLLLIEPKLVQFVNVLSTGSAII